MEKQIFVSHGPTQRWNYELPPSKLLEQVDTALYLTDAEGWLTYFNHAAAVLWGRRPLLGKERWCGSWRVYTSAGAPLPHDRCPMAVALKEDRPVRGVEGLLERPDGVIQRVRPFPTPLHDQTGRLVAASNTFALVDIDLKLPEPEYAMRQIQAVWTVYHWATLEPARIGGIPQIGLSQDEAVAATRFLNASETLKKRKRESLGPWLHVVSR